MTRDEMINQLDKIIAEKDRKYNPTIDMFDYLDMLRLSGATNMFGAGPYLIREFGLDKKVANKILLGWMDSFGNN